MSVNESPQARLERALASAVAARRSAVAAGGVPQVIECLDLTISNITEALTSLNVRSNGR